MARRVSRTFVVFLVVILVATGLIRAAMVPAVQVDSPIQEALADEVGVAVQLGLVLLDCSAFCFL